MLNHFAAVHYVCAPKRCIHNGNFISFFIQINNSDKLRCEVKSIMAIFKRFAFASLWLKVFADQWQWIVYSNRRSQTCATIRIIRYQLESAIVLIFSIWIFTFVNDKQRQNWNRLNAIEKNCFVAIPFRLEWYAWNVRAVLVAFMFPLFSYFINKIEAKAFYALHIFLFVSTFVNSQLYVVFLANRVRGISISMHNNLEQLFSHLLIGCASIVLNWTFPIFVCF